MNPADSRRAARSLARYGAMAFQMGIVIALFSWLGDYLDKKYQTAQPWWTIGLSLFGIFAALYLVLKNLISEQNDGNKKVGKSE